MIKLIACDLDATLLHDDKTFPADTFEVINKIRGLGVTFCAASGRQLRNVIHILSPLSDCIPIIAENGGVLYNHGEIVFASTMQPIQTKLVLDSLRGLNAHILVCCADGAYYADDDAEFVGETNRFYFNTQKTTYAELQTLSPCKIALFNKNNSCKIIKNVPEISGMQSLVSGLDWLDIAPKELSKGNALKILADSLNIKAEECISFGDQMNDLSMLEFCGKGYVPQNGNDYLKEQFEVIGNNNDDGVIKKLKEIFCL